MFSKGNTKAWVIGVLVALLVIFVGGTIAVGGSCYLMSRVGKSLDKLDKAATETQSDWQTYTNSRWNFSVKYPKDYTKEESVNGDGATFTSGATDIEFRAFAVYSAGSTVSQYLSGILSIARTSMPLRTVTEVDSQSQNLGNISGTMKVWKYATANSSQAEVRIAASANGKMYNLSLVCDYASYKQNLPTIKTMAESFSAS